MPIQEFNYFGPVVSPACLERAENIVSKLLSRKGELFRELDAEGQSKKLSKDPNYQHNLGYTEAVMLPGGRERNARMYFQDLAEEFKLIDRPIGKPRVIVDSAIVAAIATKAKVYKAHKDQNKVPKSRVKPLFAVTGDEAKALFTQYYRAEELAGNKVSESELDSIHLSMPHEDITVDITAMTKAEMVREASVDPIARQKEIERLVAENALLKAEQAAKATPKTPTVEASAPSPTIQ